MIRLDPIDEAVEAKQREYAPAVVGNLEDMRNLARDTAKLAERGCLPTEHHQRICLLMDDISNLEATISEYAVGTVDA